MDFLQAAFEFHRRYLSSGAGEMLDDWMLYLESESVLDSDFGGLVLELNLPDDLRNAVYSIQQHGVWMQDGYTLEPGPHDSATNARYRSKFV